MSAYFAHMPCATFMSLIDRRLIELIPDILGLPHVHIDPVILVVYYCILYHGCFLRDSNVAPQSGVDYVRNHYIGCLRALHLWQRQAIGTATDFVAAVFFVSIESFAYNLSQLIMTIMQTRVAAESFDYELAWKMLKLSWKYCRELKFHVLDDGDYVGCFSSSTSNEDRRGFWELIQVDLFFRLVLDKPPVISNSTWKVNLPWLDADSGSPPQGLKATAFLAGSRVTFGVISFFALVEDETIPKAEMLERTEAICCEIRDIFLEWRLVSKPTLSRRPCR